MDKELIIFWAIIATLILVVVLVVVSSLYFLVKDQQDCLSGHNEKYYDTFGTSMWLATKNPGFIAMNGYKDVFICDEYKP